MLWNCVATRPAPCTAPLVCWERVEGCEQTNRHKNMYVCIYIYVGMKTYVYVYHIHIFYSFERLVGD